MVEKKPEMFEGVVAKQVASLETEIAKLKSEAAKLAKEIETLTGYAAPHRKVREKFVEPLTASSNVTTSPVRW